MGLVIIKYHILLNMDTKKKFQKFLKFYIYKYNMRKYENFKINVWKVQK